MNIINGNRLDMRVLKNALARPALFEKSTAKFWDDAHISGQMLDFHLNPEVESASKAARTIEAETDFIIKATGMDSSKSVLELGCGPGLYVKEFAKTGARVVGVDISERSLDYADKNIKPRFGNVDFIRMNYLDMDFGDAFDVATLIFYDFCALSTAEQKVLLAKIHAALKDEGMFIFDVVTENRMCAETAVVSVYDAGFWSAAPYVEIQSTFMYDQPKTEGRQYTIIGEDGATRVMRIYHRLFGLAEITGLLNENRFGVEKVYKNLQGELLSEDSETYGIIARKL